MCDGVNLRPAWRGTIYCGCPNNYRSTRTALFDGIEEGGIRASAYSSHEIDEHENERAIDGLQDRVSILKRLSGDINEEVEAHNRMLDRMGNDMDTSRGFLSGTVDKFKTVFETKSSRRMGTLIASFVALFMLVYYLTRWSLGLDSVLELYMWSGGTQEHAAMVTPVYPHCCIYLISQDVKQTMLIWLLLILHCVWITTLALLAFFLPVDVITEHGVNSVVNLNVMHSCYMYDTSN